MRAPSYPLPLRFREPTLLAVLAGAVGLLLMLYRPLNRGPARWDLRTQLDEQIPLVPALVVPYLSIFVVGVLTVVVFWIRRRRRLLTSGLLAAVLTLMTSYGCYLVAQTHVSRPDVTGEDVFSGLLRMVYESDHPYNAFPSLHAGFSMLLALHWIWFDRRLGRWVAAWCGLIAISTVFVHQHYVADLAAGLLVAAAASVAARTIVRNLAARSPGGDLT